MPWNFTKTHELWASILLPSLRANKTDQSYDTRQGHQIRTMRPRINFVDHCLRNYLPSLINETPPNIMSKTNNPFPTWLLHLLWKMVISNCPINWEIANSYICHRSWKIVYKNISFWWSTQIMPMQSSIQVLHLCTRMQIWADVHEHARACLRACTKMSGYAHVSEIIVYFHHLLNQLFLWTYSFGGPPC